MVPINLAGKVGLWDIPDSPSTEMLRNMFRDKESVIAGSASPLPPPISHPIRLPAHTALELCW